MKHVCFSQEELRRLSGMAHFPVALYMRVLRPRMNPESGWFRDVGSWTGLGHWLCEDPWLPAALPPVRPNGAAVKRAVELLAQAGLMKISGAMPYADLHFPHAPRKRERVVRAKTLDRPSNVLPFAPKK